VKIIVSPFVLFPWSLHCLSFSDYPFDILNFSSYTTATKTTQHYLTNTKYKPSRIAVLIHMTHKNYRASRLSVLNYTIHLIIKKYKPSRVAILSHTTRLTNKQYRPFRVTFFNNTTRHINKKYKPSRVDVLIKPHDTPYKQEIQTF
jgi:hypothetical protein